MAKKLRDDFYGVAAVKRKEAGAKTISKISSVAARAVAAAAEE